MELDFLQQIRHSSRDNVHYSHNRFVERCDVRCVDGDGGDGGDGDGGDGDLLAQSYHEGEALSGGIERVHNLCFPSGKAAKARRLAHWHHHYGHNNTIISTFILLDDFPFIIKRMFVVARKKCKVTERRTHNL